uniref:DAGKc domain-containing protein n=1 Tax=Angiostrongylus cantonensis TaxID=6313 RepID=A0A0K0CW80_ANGCA
LFAFFLIQCLTWMVTSFRNGKIRTAYARRAREYGAAPVSAEEKPCRVTVLVNVTSNERSCYDDFVKNALPLLHLAGLQVDVIKSDSENQMEALAAAVDTQEADAIFVVGGDGTLGRVVTGILQHRESGVLPIGVFPGGYDNLSLRRLAPNVFESSRDVRRMCESAMALIEDERRNVNAFEVTVEGAESYIKPIYSVGDVGAGWFRHIEERRRKLWYLGPLKRRWAYFWEMVKHSPVDMEAKMQYEESCSGCRTCRPAVLFEPPAWRWWHILTGPPRYPEPESKLSFSTKDYSHIVNENCGQIHEVKLKGTDLIIENNQQEDTAGLRVRMGGEDAGRYGIIADGWKRCSANRVGVTDNEQFYSTDLLAKAISLTFLKIPVYLCYKYLSL